MLLDNPQTLRYSDAKASCFVSQDDHCFLVVPDQMFESLWSRQVGAQDVGPTPLTKRRWLE